MKNTVKIKLFCSAVLSFSAIFSSGQPFVQLNCNDFVWNSLPYKPLVVNYSISFVTDDFGLYFISPYLLASTAWNGPSPVFGYNGPSNNNKTCSTSKLHGDLTRIKNAGFNTIRLIGAGAFLNTSGNFDIPTGNYTTYYNLLSQFLTDCNTAGLKVIILLTGQYEWKVND